MFSNDSLLYTISIKILKYQCVHLKLNSICVINELVEGKNRTHGSRLVIYQISL